MPKTERLNRAVNTYPLDNRGDAIFNARKVKLLRDAHEATGRPVLLAEWGVRGMDVNLQSPAAQHYTQAERARGHLKVSRQDDGEYGIIGA